MIDMEKQKRSFNKTLKLVIAEKERGLISKTARDYGFDKSLVSSVIRQEKWIGMDKFFAICSACEISPSEFMLMVEEELENCRNDES